MMKSKPLRASDAEHLLGVGALGDVLDVGDVGVVDVLAQVLEALVVGLAPAAVVVGPDEDHGDVELAFLRSRGFCVPEAAPCVQPVAEAAGAEAAGLDAAPEHRSRSPPSAPASSRARAEQSDRPSIYLLHRGTRRAGTADRALSAPRPPSCQGAI